MQHDAIVIKDNPSMNAVDRSPQAVLEGRSEAIERPRSTGEHVPRLLAAGGLLAGLGMAACCVVPFVLFVLGVSGAWIGDLTALKPYQPIFMALAIASIGYGFYLVYRRPKVVCDDGSYCASPRSGRIAKIGLWLATVLAIAAFSFPYAVIYFIDT
jgi:mercuric ion transport protein